MFRDRPLTWLFVIATICVDVVIAVAMDAFVGGLMLVMGGVFGQVGAMAIWAVRGRSHRLLRSSCFVLASGLLVYSTFQHLDFLALVFFYASVILVVAVPLEIMRTLYGDEVDEIERRKRLRFPLIEFFGWTILIAIVSFGCRNIDFAFFFDPKGWSGLLRSSPILVIPILLVLLTRKDLRDLGVFKALLIVGAVVGAEWYYGFLLVTTQAMYLTAWMTVLTLDNISVEAAEARSSTGDNVQLVDEPKLFNPQD